jgi:hypothetical protein
VREQPRNHEDGATTYDPLAQDRVPAADITNSFGSVGAQRPAPSLRYAWSLAAPGRLGGTLLLVLAYSNGAPRSSGPPRRPLREALRVTAAILDPDRAARVVDER